VENGNGGGDTLNGEGGNDTLVGGPGADYLDGGDGANPCIGGYDNDVYVTAHCEDVTPPKIVSFDFNPKAVDTSTASQDVTFTAHFLDDLSGFSWCHIEFHSPNGMQALYVDFTRVAGDAFDGDYQGTATLPQFSQFGNWKIYYYHVQDVVGNYTHVQHWPDTPMYFADLGFPTTISNG
jgi:hypothetical protein